MSRVWVEGFTIQFGISLGISPMECLGMELFVNQEMTQFRPPRSRDETWAFCDLVDLGGRATSQWNNGFGRCRCQANRG